LAVKGRQGYERWYSAAQLRAGRPSGMALYVPECTLQSPSMIVIFVHGWSVRSTDTYGQLPARLREGAGKLGGELKTGNLFLSQYVSFQDDVTLDDIARAFHQALAESVLPHLGPAERFACITHSTGGPVVRKWLDVYYGPDRLSQCPMSHLVMLAPPNHGSALAQLGKSRLSRIKFLLEGAEPGKRVLDWLELGSAGQWELNLGALDYRYADNGLFPFVLIGQKIDRSMYDHLNSYTGEAGSDGVVRAAAANMNFSYICLDQADGELKLRHKVRSPRMAFGVLPGRSHSGEQIGIIRSVPEADLDPARPNPTVEWVLRCLGVTDSAGYQRVCTELDELTSSTQEAERIEETKKLVGSTTCITDRYSMLTLMLRDDRGEQLTNYDLLLTAGPNYDPDELPDGFFRDRQRNLLNPGSITYFLNHSRMEQGLLAPAMEQKLGMRVVARPDSGLAYYSVAELRSDVATVQQLLRPNETTMVEITLRRAVDLAVFRLTDRLEPSDISPDPLLKYLPPDADEEEDRRRRLAGLVDRLESSNDPEERKRARRELTRFIFGSDV
jgi:hypothetical protein